MSNSKMHEYVVDTRHVFISEHLVHLYERYTGSTLEEEIERFVRIATEGVDPSIAPYTDSELSTRALNAILNEIWSYI